MSGRAETGDARDVARVDSAVHTTQLCMREPSMNDFLVNNEEHVTCNDLRVIIGWISHTDQLLSLANKDPDLKENTNDISMLYLRKASLYCSVNDFQAAKLCAEQALSTCESSLGHFRMGCIQYCLHEYGAALESLSIAERLEPSNVHIQRALLVCLARSRSIKDRISVVHSII